MDYARKIGKSDKPTKWEKRPIQILTANDGFVVKDEPISEDRRLVNWRTWLSNRKKQYQRINSTTGRSPKDQLLNSCENVRPLIEMRNLMDYATIPAPVVPDKYRSGPEFWRTPEILSNRGNPCLPDVFVTPNKKELNLMPELTYVDLPELIEQEKELSGLKSKEPRWKSSKYLRDRRKELSREIELLVPKEPQTNELVIQGHAPRERKKEPRIPPITISVPEENDETENDFDQAIILKIQDREVVWQKSNFEEKTKHDPLKWNLTFSSKIDRRTEGKIVFENKGNRVIVYKWRQASLQTKLFRLERQISPFFFNKTDEVILPGQIVELKVWYLPRNHGVLSESWRLVTDPELYPSPLIIRFWGCCTESTESESKRKLKNPLLIDEYLNECIRDSVIREIVNEIMEGIDHSKPPEPSYGSLFLEAEIFTAKNPLCFYHPNVLIEFRQMHRDITNRTVSPWNLSLNDLRELLLRIDEPKRRNDMLIEFTQLCKSSFRPTLCRRMETTKYEIVYNILCCFANLFEAESEFTMDFCLAREDREHSSKTMEMDAELENSYTDSNETEEMTEDCISSVNYSLYREIFFVRINELLNDVLRRILAGIDSFDTLNERDK